jgi:hypothetical protein
MESWNDGLCKNHYSIIPILYARSAVKNKLTAFAPLSYTPWWQQLLNLIIWPSLTNGGFYEQGR